MELFMVIKIYWILEMTMTVAAQKGTIRYKSEICKRAKEVYDSDLVLTCEKEEEIAMASFHHGFKPMSSTCSRNSGGDCLQESPTEARFTDIASGRSNAIIPTCIVHPDTGGRCDNATLYTPISFYSELEYLCIPKKRIAEMFDFKNLTSPRGVPVYLQNRGYSTGSPILSSDKEFSCSVEVLSSKSGLVVYTLHQELAGTVNNCLQTINMTDSEGNVLKTIRCDPPTYNRISKEKHGTNFMVVTLSNTNSANSGKFWFGFEASDRKSAVRLECPAVNKTDCGDLENPVNGTVRFSCTTIDCTARYTCTNGFSMSSGSVSRTCQEDSAWSGTQAVCTPKEKAAEESDSWKEATIGVSVAFGAFVFLLIVVGLCVACFCCRK